MTRIPVPYPADNQGNPTSRPLAEASWAFPLVGLVVGASASFILIIAEFFHLPVYASALLAITTTILITGALHEDGLADVADGFGGAHKRERKLEIMKDSMIGSYGALALCISVLLRTVLIGSLLEWGTQDQIIGDQAGGVPAYLNGAISVIIAAHIIGRGYAPLIMSHLPLARSEGLAAMASKPKLRSSYGGFLLTLLIVFTLLPTLSAAIVLSLALLVIILLSWLSMKQIGGYTGDVLGAGVQLCEITVYLTVISYIT
ncbi:adenosylcobinamide-GDP ribazoletransferase [Kiloniella sp.]|uniref:adenosylcobinamide-GDP ribazoletransferase n=1 Tax=Kiloniella sp. TaxID=1938587 RepID=UPI003B02B1E0